MNSEVRNDFLKLVKYQSTYIDGTDKSQRVLNLICLVGNDGTSQAILSGAKKITWEDPVGGAMESIGNVTFEIPSAFTGEVTVTGARLLSAEAMVEELMNGGETEVDARDTVDSLVDLAETDSLTYNIFTSVDLDFDLTLGIYLDSPNQVVTGGDYVQITSVAITVDA